MHARYAYAIIVCIYIVATLAHPGARKTAVSPCTHPGARKIAANDWLASTAALCCKTTAASLEAPKGFPWPAAPPPAPALPGAAVVVAGAGWAAGAAGAAQCFCWPPRDCRRCRQRLVLLFCRLLCRQRLTLLLLRFLHRQRLVLLLLIPL